jgi:hypothetical protein
MKERAIDRERAIVADHEMTTFPNQANVLWTVLADTLHPLDQGYLTDMAPIYLRAR